MNVNKISSVISILSVLVMIIWGTVGNDWGHSWLAVVVGGALIAVIRIIWGKDKK